MFSCRNIYDEWTHIFRLDSDGERIPAGGHVEPSEQRGQHGQANDDDHGHDVAGEAFDVAYEQLPDCTWQ